MSANPIVIEERLATRELTGLLALGAFGVLVRRRHQRHGRLGQLLNRCQRVLRMVALPTIAIVAWLSSCVVVRVVDTPDGRNLDVLYGPNGIIVQSFEAREILGASVVQAPMWRMGGLGYRGSLTLFKRAALITRRGDALALDLTRSRRFIVTVDEPQSFVDALVV
ncbi:MAG: hypothetical protein ACYC5Z_04040 [Acidimicrobiales bacterium]